MEAPKKQNYTKPKLIVYGNVSTITKGSSAGSFLDAAFAAGTPYGDLTFS
jgi:hypothetical protein